MSSLLSNLKKKHHKDKLFYVLSYRFINILLKKQCGLGAGDAERAVLRYSSDINISSTYF